MPKLLTKSKKRLGLKKNGRVDYKCAETRSALDLASYGMHARTIAECSTLTVPQVYYRLKKIGIHLRDYRNGIGPKAEPIVRRFTVE